MIPEFEITQGGGELLDVGGSTSWARVTEVVGFQRGCWLESQSPHML